MNVGKFFYSFFNLLIAIFFILLGIIGMLIPQFPSLETLFIMFIRTNPVILSLVGALLIMIGTALILNILLLTRHRHYLIRSGKHTVAIDESLIQQYLDSYWKELFPKYEIPSALMIKPHAVHITVDLPFLPLSQQQPFLEKIEREISHMFATKIGYKNEVILAASFPEKGSQA